MTTSPTQAAFAVIDQVIVDFHGSGICSDVCAGALNAMRLHWAHTLAHAKRPPMLISDDITETIKRLEIMRAEITRRLLDEPVQDQTDMEPPTLIADHPEQSGSDFVLRPDAKSAWVTVDNISIHIIRQDDGVEIMTHPKACEDEELEHSYTYFDSAEEAIAAFHSVDLDDVEQWVDLHYQRHFDAESIVQRHEWIRRYIDSRASASPDLALG
jgi:hypothetical protein